MYELLVSIDFWRIIAQICNLLILVHFIKKFLFDKVQAVLAQRKAETEAIYTDAEAARTEANTLKAEYEQNMATARQQAAQLVQTATQTAQQRTDEMLDAARRDAAAMKAKAEADIAQERKKAVNELKDQIGGIAMDIAGKVVERELDPADHAALIDEFIKDVGEAS